MVNKNTKQGRGTGVVRIGFNFPGNQGKPYCGADK